MTNGEIMFALYMEEGNRLFAKKTAHYTEEERRRTTADAHSALWDLVADEVVSMHPDARERYAEKSRVRIIPCVVMTGMTGASDALAPESLLEAALAQTASSVCRFFKENPDKFREVRYFTLVCDHWAFNDFQELADSLKPGWTPPE